MKSTLSLYIAPTGLRHAGVPPQTWCDLLAYGARLRLAAVPEARREQLLFHWSPWFSCHDPAVP